MGPCYGCAPSPGDAAPAHTSHARRSQMPETGLDPAPRCSADHKKTSRTAAVACVHSPSQEFEVMLESVSRGLTESLAYLFLIVSHCVISKDAEWGDEN